VVKDSPPAVFHAEGMDFIPKALQSRELPSADGGGG